MSDIKIGSFWQSKEFGLAQVKDVRSNGVGGRIVVIDNLSGLLDRPSLDFFLQSFEPYDDEVKLGFQDYEQKGRKDDSAKIRYSLLPVGTVNQVVQVLEFGSKKYADNNWQKVPSARTRYYDAAMRHIDAWWNGELLDLDKGDQKGSHLPHLAHAICCLMFLMWFDSEANDD